jgi:GNAT superfamily N-acetyltransferase
MNPEPDAPSRWIRLRRGLARGGVEYALTAGVSYLPNRLMQYTHHVLLRCEGRAARVRGGAGPAVGIGSTDHLEALIRPGDLSREVLEQRFHDGDLCVLVLEEGLILASAWAATGTRYLAGLSQTLHVPPAAFYIHDTFTAPEARRRGLATACYARLFDHFAAQGRTTAYAAVEVLNQPSLVAHARWGFVPVGRARKLALGRLRSTFAPRWPEPNQRFRVFVRPQPPPWPYA